MSLQQFLLAKWASSAPKEAMRIPEAASWLTLRPFQPCPRAHSLSDCCQPRTCHTHEPPAEPRPPTARIAPHTALRASSIRDPTCCAGLEPARLPLLGRERSKALSG